MSEFEVGPTAVGGIMLTSLFVVAVVMTGLAFGNSTRMQVEDLGKISERSALHMMENCLKNGNEYIDSEFLNSNIAGFDLCSGCGICNMGNLATRVETSDGWSWESDGYVPPNTEKQAHEIFVNVQKGDDVVIGKLILRVNG